jgi:tetratricopeptide (TPR) repeat protein
MDHDLEREPLPIFLRQVYSKKLSGHLYVTARDFHISLNLIKGILVNGMSTRFDEKLSVLLHVMGRINEEQYNFLGGLHQFSDDQVTEILLDHNFTKKKDIYYARIYQLRRIAISTFSLKRGKWIFTAGEPDPPLRETYEIPLAGILVEGARAVDHISFYAGKWQHCLPVLFKEIPQDNEIYFTEREQDFYAAVQRQGSRSCRELIARLNILPMDFWRHVLAFHLLGIIEFEKSGGASDISPDIAALLELNQKMQGSAVDGLALLGLGGSAAAAEIENARAEALARFAPERFGSAAAPEIKNIARQVCQRLQAVAVRLEVEPVLQDETPRREFSAAARRLDVDPFLTGEKPGRKFSPDAAPAAATVAAGAHERAWELLLLSKELYEQREFAKAIPLLKQAIKLESGQGDFYYLLGLCQCEAEIMKNDAEINLKKAIELKSWSADPVYALGILYRGQDRRQLAERCFQRVKEIAHDHTGASRELVDLRRQKAASKGKTPFLKKKIF